MANTIGEKELKTKWPHEQGLTARTTSQIGRNTQLVASKSNVSSLKLKGLNR